MVDLGDERESVVIESLCDPELPERLRPIELLGEDAPCETFQLGFRPRAGEARVADVVLEIEVVASTQMGDRPSGVEASRWR